MKTLILTEKPSVARDFAYALKVAPQGNGFFETGNVIITWAIGHLMELKSPEEYDPKWKRWSLTSLPILPDRLMYKANSKTKKQLSVVLKQLKRKDIDKIVLATDAGREGELIGRTLLNDASSKAICYRFWTSQALSPEVIKENMIHLLSLSEYDRIYYAGRCRQSADWLVGMNLSRLATLRMGDLFSVGRVQTAVLALLVNKRLEIDNFKPEPYFTINGQFKFTEGEVAASWFDPAKKNEATRVDTDEEVQKILKRCEGKDAIVDSVTKEKKQQVPPQLFSLTELQKVANRLYGFSAKNTLTLAQSLYEKHKCLSYPRTDARVLGSKALSQVKGLISQFQKKHPDYFKYFDPSRVDLKNQRVFNDSKLTDHHALIPLGLKNGSLSNDEMKIYQLVLKRFIAAFSQNYTYEETKVQIKVGEENFKTKGQRILCLGWRSLGGGDKEQFLPPLEETKRGEVVSIESEKKATKPPAEYTEATLLQDMINPSRLVEEQQLKKIFRGDAGLGTQATRAQIIETLLNRKYIQRKKKNLIALPKGMTLIDNFKKLKLSQVLACPEETAKWELELEKISQGEGSPRDFMLGIRKFVADCTEEWKSAPVQSAPAVVSESTTTSKGKNPNSIGECPLCKGSVVESPKSFSCERWREGCKFTVWKKIAGKKISKAQVANIIKKGKSSPLKGFKSKAGKTFNATLVLNKEKGVSFEFNNKD